MPDSRLDDFAIRFGGDGAGMSGAAGTSGATNAMEVDFVVLWRRIVENGVDILNVKAASGEVGGEEEGDLAGSEGLDTLDALVIKRYISKAISSRIKSLGKLFQCNLTNLLLCHTTVQLASLEPT